jgi:hypothetical protein
MDKKIEFIEETIINGTEFETIYYTNINGQYVSRSLSHSRETAELIYNLLKKSRGNILKTTVLESDVI